MTMNNGQKKLMLLGGLRYLIPVIEEAHRMGVYVITADYLPNNIAHQYSDEYVNVSITDKDAVLSAAKRLQIDGILSHAVDPGVVAAAYTAEQMGLPFQCSYHSAQILQDKVLFRTFLNKNGFNCPHFVGISSLNEALEAKKLFSYPIIVKPVDSAGSKGVTKVNGEGQFIEAVKNALKNSISGRCIIEDFMDKLGSQSSADVFTRKGQLVYSTYSDQLFDPNAANPFTPAVEIWPSTMEKTFQIELDKQLQRLATLLELRTGIYNVETRVCTDRKAYIMEVSPRGGGNRIAELQSMATGQNLIKAEIQKSLNMPIDQISAPKFDGVWCNYILHSSQEGIFNGLVIEDSIRPFVRDISLIVSTGDKVYPFTGANTSLGTMFLRFESRHQMDYELARMEQYIHILVK